MTPEILGVRSRPSDAAKFGLGSLCPPVSYPITTYPYGKLFLTPERCASKELYFDVETRCHLHGTGNPYLEPAGAADASGNRDAHVSYRSTKAGSDWWPADLGEPGEVGAQNNLRYAVFPETRRLAIDDRGHTQIFDTGDHGIFGLAQAQSSDQTLTFTSQSGLVRIDQLDKIEA